MNSLSQKAVFICVGLFFSTVAMAGTLSDGNMKLDCSDAMIFEKAGQDYSKLTHSYSVGTSAPIFSFLRDVISPEKSLTVSAPFVLYATSKAIFDDIGSLLGNTKSNFMKVFNSYCIKFKPFLYYILDVIKMITSYGY